MAYCANCGTKMEARYCARCGSPAQAGGGAAVAAPESKPGAPPAYRAPDSAPLPDNAAAALCYVLGPITGVLFLAMEPYRRTPNIRFHAWQSIFLSLAEFVAMSLVNATLGLFLTAVSLGLLASMLSVLMAAAVFAIWIYMLVTAYQGKTVALPVVGPWARKQA